jgi:hypothetical protein
MKPVSKQSKSRDKNEREHVREQNESHRMNSSLNQCRNHRGETRSSSNSPGSRLEVRQKEFRNKQGPRANQRAPVFSLSSEASRTEVNSRSRDSEKPAV